jgi:hypothetical protein
MSLAPPAPPAAAAAVLQPSTDIQEAALQPPVSVEALVAPEVWTDWHEEHMRRADSCDACGDTMHKSSLQVCSLPACVVLS